MPVVLPPELQRYIFEISVGSCRSMALTLVLVAYRVQIWIDPLLYEMVTLSTWEASNSFLCSIDSKPPTFFANHVKSLCMTANVDDDAASRILSICSGVENLACWVNSSSIMPVLSRHRPRRLSLYGTGVSGPDCQPDFGSPLFSKITHLELTDNWALWSTWSGFDLIPCLEHLALWLDSFQGHLLIADLSQNLARCLTLKICVLFAYFPEAFELSRDVKDDPRFVVLPHPKSIQGHWESSSLGDHDS